MGKISRILIALLLIVTMFSSSLPLEAYTADIQYRTLSTEQIADLTGKAEEPTVESKYSPYISAYTAKVLPLKAFPDTVPAPENKEPDTEYFEVPAVKYASAPTTIGSGTCGENLTWTLASDGTLIISGTGAMTDWNGSLNIPWYSQCSSIKVINIGADITSIGSSAFNGCTNLSEIVFSSDSKLTSIGAGAFACCSSLTKMDIPSGVTSIDCNAFMYCEKLKTVVFLGNAPAIGAVDASAFNGTPQMIGGDSAYNGLCIYYNSKTSGWNDYNGFTTSFVHIEDNDTTTMYFPVIPLVDISSQPVNYNGDVNSSATFTVAASGEEITYQWQFATRGSTVWKNSGQTGYNTPTMTIMLTESRNGNQYRCVITDKYGNEVISNAATMSITSGITITSQPEDYNGAANTNATFTVSATGDELTYQWQFTTRGSTVWKNSGQTGYNTPTMTIMLTEARNGNQYRCVITDKYGNKVTSDAATMALK